MRRRCYQLAIVGLALVAIAIRHLQNDDNVYYPLHFTRIMIILLMNEMNKRRAAGVVVSREHFRRFHATSWTMKRDETSMNTSFSIAWQMELLPLGQCDRDTSAQKAGKVRRAFFSESRVHSGTGKDTARRVVVVLSYSVLYSTCGKK
jgi:hypothetical protein